MDADITSTDTGPGGSKPCGMGTEAVVMVAELTEIVDFDALVEYWQKVQPLLSRYGAVVLAQSVGGGVRVEGAPAAANTICTVQLWPSRERFDEFWGSAAYASIRKLRRDACTSTITVLPVAA